MISSLSTLPTENRNKVKLKRKLKKERDGNFLLNWIFPSVAQSYYFIMSSYRNLLGTASPSCQGQRREACEQRSGLSEAEA